MFSLPHDKSQKVALLLLIQTLVECVTNLLLDVSCEYDECGCSVVMDDSERTSSSLLLQQHPETHGSREGVSTVVQICKQMEVHSLDARKSTMLLFDCLCRRVSQNTVSIGTNTKCR